MHATPFTVVAFGASTTAPREDTFIFADHLREALQESNPDAKVINAGVPGNTTTMARERFQSDVLSHKPDLVIICFGINDSTCDVWKDPPVRTPRVSLAVYLENMEHFVGSIRKNGGEVLLMTTQPLCWTPHMRELYGSAPYDPTRTDGFNVILRTYTEALREFAKKWDIGLVDVFSAFEKFARTPGNQLSQLLPDGMHPNSSGHKIIANLLLPKVMDIHTKRLTLNSPKAKSARLS